MALRNIVTVGDPVLTKVCRPVTKFDDRLSQLIDDMIETLHDANGAGLAAPQIGVLRRVVIVNTEGEDWELVNPEIVEVSEEEQTGIEGCLSLPGKWGWSRARNTRRSVRRTETETGMNMKAKI